MHKNKLNFLVTIIFLILAISGCKNYYNDTINWVDNIKSGADINTGKSLQPNFVTIDWNNPEVVGSARIYQIQKIKGNNDPLHMSHFLVFEKNRFLRRESRK